MRAQAISLALVVACGGAGSQNDGGANDAGDASVADVGAADVSVDAPVPPPPSATCTAPISPPDTSKPTTVVGTGTAASCTETALTAAIAQGGIVTFDCGGAATISITKTLDLRTDVDTTIDGGGKVTLDGGGAVQIMSFNHADYRKNTTLLTLMNLTLAHGKNHGTMAYAPAPAPCSQGFYDGYAGALFVRDGEVAIFDTVFDGNQAEELGPDVGGGGGAISLQGVLKATIVGSTFVNGLASNGGAIESLNSDFDVYNSIFDTNVATGNGANSDDAGKCSVVATNGQHQVGSGGNGGAVAIDGGSDGTHTFCGSVFKNNQAGSAALAGAIGRTPDGAKQTTILDRCTFDGNQAAQGGGGALYFHNSTLQVHGSTFHANVAKGCGAIQADGTTFDLVNDTFEGNQTNASGAVGGAICLFGGDGTLDNVTIANGKVDGFGAAIFGNPTLTIQNSLFANNVGNNAGAPMQCQVTATGSNNLQFPAKHTSGGAADTPCVPGITFADPMLASLGDNGGPTQTMLVQTGSPALGLGQTCPATDQRGTTRPASGCTSGATEGTK
ncbi:MAG TPA: choice-of-anchor Q domain-containing protein [Polyangiaceae bacterium]|jgi:predicted outer membrane repeat protein